MRFTELLLKDFRGFAGEQKIPLHPEMTVLVGVNGAGKSSVLEAAAIVLTSVDMTVEHWAARSGGADPFHWPDLLGVCRGKSGDDEHCDRGRGDRALTLHPARLPAVDALVRHLGDGTIEIDARDSSGRIRRKGHEADVSILNLNAPGLKKDRRAVVDAVLRVATAADATRLRALLETWEAPDAEGFRPEFAGVGTYLLRRALRTREARSRRVRRLPRS
jgi:energy-coupling factor transporter ATP-binding protein EcfA2